MDDITSFILENFYKDDRRLAQDRRVSAIVGACYLLNLKRNHPEIFGERDARMLAQMLSELNLEETKAADLLEELNRGWDDKD